MVPLITTAQDTLLTSVSTAMANSVSLSTFNTYALTVTGGLNNQRHTAPDWRYYVDAAWTAGQAQSPATTAH